MFFSKEFLIAISFAGAVGISLILSRANNRATDEFKPKNNEEDLEVSKI